MKTGYTTNGLHLLLLVFLVCLLYSCANVLSKQPLPVGEGEILQTAPESLLGEYHPVRTNDRSQTMDLGEATMGISAPDKAHCIVEYYFSFTKDDLKPDSIARHYELHGKFLRYHNDSLINRYQNLKAKIDSEPTNTRNAAELAEVNELEREEQGGHLQKIYSVETINGKLTYGHQLAEEIDFTNGTFNAYDENGHQNHEKLVLKHYKDLYCLNLRSVTDSESLWHTFFLLCRHDSLTVSYLDASVLKSNLSYYQGITSIDTTGRHGDVLINPSAAQLNTLVKDDKAMSKMMVYIKVKSSSSNKHRRLLIVGLIALIAFGLGYFVKRKRV